MALKIIRVQMKVWNIYYPHKVGNLGIEISTSQKSTMNDKKSTRRDKSEPEKQLENEEIC